MKKFIALFGVLVLGSLVWTQSALALPYNTGDVFAGVGGSTINHYTPAGVFVQGLNTGSGSNEETGMAFDAAGNLYATNFTAGNMSKFDNNGGLLVHPWGGPFHTHPESVVIDGAGNIYVGEVDGGPPHIHKFDAAGNLLATFTPATENRGIDWIDLAADQCTMFYTSEGSLIKRFDVCTDTQLPDFAVLPTSPAYALRIRSNGEVLVAATAAVHRLDATGAVIQNYTAASVGEISPFFALNLDPDNSSFWTAGYFSGNIYQIDIATGALLSSFNAPPNPTLAGLAIFGEPTVAQADFDLDIKPGSCPNPINHKSKGGVPVAILGAEGRDVSEIIPNSVRLEGVAPVEGRWVVVDVATPFTGELCDCHEACSDGFDDLVLHFSTQAVVAALGLGPGDVGDNIQLTLSATLVDGTVIEVSDCVIVVGKKK